jgi:hypothetical protein
MKTTNIAFLIFAILCFSISYGQIKTDTATLTRIKEAYRQINDYKNYKVVTIDDSEEFLGHGTDNGWSLKGYYKGDSLKKIVEWVGLSNRVIENEYYFDKGKLVFVYSKVKAYKFNDSLEVFDQSKFEKEVTRRYYFNNDQLIHAIHSKKEAGRPNHQTATDFLQSGKEYTNLLNTKRK